TWPQVPQLSPSDCKYAQYPVPPSCGHSVWPVAPPSPTHSVLQMPPEHTCGAEERRVGEPRMWPSDWKYEQDPVPPGCVHSVWPVAPPSPTHSVLQMLAEHSCGEGQTWPQVPQLSPSDCKYAQYPVPPSCGHSVWPVAPPSPTHSVVQMPPEHTC